MSDREVTDNLDSIKDYLAIFEVGNWLTETHFLKTLNQQKLIFFCFQTYIYFQG